MIQLRSFSNRMLSNGTPKNFWEIIVYGPVVQSYNQGPFKTIKAQNTHNVSSTLVSFKSQSDFV